MEMAHVLELREGDFKDVMNRTPSGELTLLSKNLIASLVDSRHHEVKYVKQQTTSI